MNDPISLRLLPFISWYIPRADTIRTENADSTLRKLIAHNGSCRNAGVSCKWCCMNTEISSVYCGLSVCERTLYYDTHFNMQRMSMLKFMLALIQRSYPNNIQARGKHLNNQS